MSVCTADDHVTQEEYGRLEANLAEARQTITSHAETIVRQGNGLHDLRAELSKAGEREIHLVKDRKEWRKVLIVERKHREEERQVAILLSRKYEILRAELRAVGDGS